MHLVTRSSSGKLLLVLLLSSASAALSAQSPAVPDWAQPGSATHKQIPPPPDFHRRTVTTNTPLGLFAGQSDIGAAVVPGTSTYNPSTKQYTLHSAGYNIWYTRDEFRYVWKQVSGDVSLAADAAFPDPKGYNDRKAVLVIRQSLDDDSAEAMIGEHGTGMIHLAERTTTGASMQDMQYRFGGLLDHVLAKRIGIQKHGDSITILASLQGEPMHPLGPPVNLHLVGPFYVGIGFCSHLPDKADTAIFSDVVLNTAPGAAKEQSHNSGAPLK